MTAHARPPKRARGPSFPFVGGHSALDLVNTRPLSGGQPTELLATPADLGAWLLRTRLATSDELTSVDAALLREVRALRQALRQGLDAIIEGEAPPAALLEAVNTRLRADRGHRTMRAEPAGRKLEFTSTGPPAVRILGRLAAAAADLLAVHDLRRIRECGSPDCVLVFYDASKGGRRRWCRMAVCGNRAKVAAFRRRQLRRAGG